MPKTSKKKTLESTEPSVSAPPPEEVTTPLDEAKPEPPKKKVKKTKKDEAPAAENMPTEEKEAPVAAPAKPKRPKNAFMFYSEHNRARVKTQFELTGVADVAKKLGEEWRALSEADKQPYLDMQAEAKKAVEA